MKFFIYIFLLAFNLITLCHADEPIENAMGQQIEVLDESKISTNLTWQDKAQEVLLRAFSLTGIPYKIGGNSPETGFDCSGFVRYVFSQATNLSLPPTARAISQLGKHVNKNELQPGDLVFFNTLKSAFSHVGIYVGDNKFIHSPRSGGEVRVENMQNGYWASRFEGAKRLDREAENTTDSNKN